MRYSLFLVFPQAWRLYSCVGVTKLIQCVFHWRKHFYWLPVGDYTRREDCAALHQPLNVCSRCGRPLSVGLDRVSVLSAVLLACTSSQADSHDGNALHLIVRVGGEYFAITSGSSSIWCSWFFAANTEMQCDGRWHCQNTFFTRSAVPSLAF